MITAIKKYIYDRRTKKLAILQAKRSRLQFQQVAATLVKDSPLYPAVCDRLVKQVWKISTAIIGLKVKVQNSPFYQNGSN